MHLWRLRVRTFVLAACGWAYVYLLIANVAGEMMAVSGLQEFPESVEKSCRPFFSMFGAIDVQCEDPWAQFAWSWALTKPRFFVVPAYVAVGLIWVGIKNADIVWGLEGAVWAVFAIPFLIVALLGFRYWGGLSSVVAWTVTGAFAVLIVQVGLRM